MRKIPLMTLNNIDSNLKKTEFQGKGQGQHGDWWAFILFKIINSKGLKLLIWETERTLFGSTSACKVNF